MTTSNTFTYDGVVTNHVPGVEVWVVRRYRARDGFRYVCDDHATTPRDVHRTSLAPGTRCPECGAVVEALNESNDRWREATGRWREATGTEMLEDIVDDQDRG